MALWVFQMVFNCVMAGFAVAWVLSRRRERRAERSRPVTAALPAPLPAAGASVSPVPLETPLGSPVSTLSEKRVPELRGSQATSLDAYEKADFLLSKGMSMREVSRQTGLSLGELQLIGKLAHKSQ